ncbi:hypothetical protein N2152v2_006305 [Parachlorella kessleri]
MAPSYQVLQYKYVPDISEKRLPFREEHLQGAQKLAAANKLLVGGAVAEPVDSGIFIFRDTSKEAAANKLVMAGALAEPVDGALFIFRDTSREEIESFVQHDPYVKNGLVPEW